MKRLATSARGVILVLFTALAVLSTSCQGAAETKDAPADSSAVVQASTSQTSTAGQTAATGSEALFVTYCAKCHGPKGLGDGPSVGSLRTQSGMNLTILKDKSDEEILTTISQGKGTEMPPWGLILTLEERQDLVKHIRTLSSP